MYVQYTDPAGYPPLEHSAHLLASAGWKVLFAGIQSYGVRFGLRPHDRVTVARLGGRPGGVYGILKYATFVARTVAQARRFAPSWIYASDAMSAPVALIVRKITGARVVYHEHDIPGEATNPRTRAIMRARKRLIATADVVVVPSEGRRAALGEHRNRAVVVWNCPLADEVAEKASEPRDHVTLVYAGSITPHVLPDSFIRALPLLPLTVRLRIIGYQTAGAPHYVENLLAVAKEIGVGDRVEFRGAVERRVLLGQELGACDIGLATINTAANESMRTMAGASNKAFDYMARGLPIIVTDDPAWREMYVEPGFGAACDPRDPASIAAAVNALLDGAVRKLMGERARRRIRDEWNYARQFAPVFDVLNS